MAAEGLAPIAMLADERGGAKQGVFRVVAIHSDDVRRQDLLDYLNARANDGEPTALHDTDVATYWRQMAQDVADLPKRTPACVRRFLELYVEIGYVGRAAKAAGVDETLAYRAINALARRAGRGRIHR